MIFVLFWGGGEGEVGREKGTVMDCCGKGSHILFLWDKSKIFDYMIV